MPSPAFTAAELAVVVVWFFVGFWNSSVGPTGGVVFTSMASLMPPSAVIPLQAVVETGSGLLRTWLLRLFIDWQFLLLFAASSLLGFAAGVALRVIAVPSEDLLRLIMGTAILLSVWVPAANAAARHRAFPWVIGSATAFVGLFASGVGSFIASAIAMKHEDHRRVVATLSASLICQHGAKVMIFGALGFSFAQYAYLLVAMMAAALAGAGLGARFALSVPQRIVKPLFTAVVTLLALNLLRLGLTA